MNEHNIFGFVLNVIECFVKQVSFCIKFFLSNFVLSSWTKNRKNLFTWNESIPSRGYISFFFLWDSKCPFKIMNGEKLRKRPFRLLLKCLHHFKKKWQIFLSKEISILLIVTVWIFEKLAGIGIQASGTKKKAKGLQRKMASWKRFEDC